jgi:hypothetical protein
MQHMQGMAMNATPTHGVRLVFPATEALRRIWPARLDRLSVSFVRVDGARNPARGEVVRVKAFRVEADPVM